MKAKILTTLFTAGILISSNLYAGTLKVGASPVPHAELLNLVKDDLKKEGVDLKVIEFTDFVTPNEALISGELDANYFQHIPHLNLIMKKEQGADLVAAAKIHVEPLGVYSKKIKSLDELKEKSIVAIPSDSTNGGRSLILLHNAGIIKLSDPTNLLATPFDIVENPKKIKFQELDAAFLPRTLDSVDAAVITGNYALQAGYVPAQDSILLEGKESPYVNVLAIRKESENNEDIKKLADALTSEKVKKYINEKYNGAVVPAF